MKNIRHKFKIVKNIPVSEKTWFMSLQGDVSEIKRAGQFVNIEIPGKYLRRPISVHRYYPESNILELLYDVVGQGTRELSEMKGGEILDVLVGLGNGFSITDEINNPILLGGGIGCAPLFQLAVDLVYAGKKPQVVLGFNTSKDIVPLIDNLKNIGIPVYIATVDGSLGTKGFVTDTMRENNIQYDYFYACGPMPMLRSLSKLPVDGELSLESRMGCGFGACMCCSVPVVAGYKRICKEGPVFKKDEIIWK